jgi:molybdopterin-guanine dinucleotide biosynthesis protein A
MGRDKALLPYRGGPLVGHVAGIVRDALGGLGPVAILAEPDRYRDLGYPVYPDLFPDCGPLGGVVTALKLSASDLNLVVACDMPMLSAASLRTLLARAFASGARATAARCPAGEPEPLCAVYHRHCLGALERAILDKRFRMKTLLLELQPDLVDFPPDSLANMNTPEQWMEFEGQPG